MHARTPARTRTVRDAVCAVQGAAGHRQERQGAADGDVGVADYLSAHMQSASFVSAPTM